MDLNTYFTQTMRDELTRIGFEELTTPEAVDAALAARKGTALVFVNSVCGCAAGMARPGMALALEKTSARPDRLPPLPAHQKLRKNVIVPSTTSGKAMVMIRPITCSATNGTTPR